MVMVVVLVVAVVATAFLVVNECDGCIGVGGGCASQVVLLVFLPIVLFIV